MNGEGGGGGKEWDEEGGVGSGMEYWRLLKRELGVLAMRLTEGE